jgi:hypothetical protein
VLIRQRCSLSDSRSSKVGSFKGSRIEVKNSIGMNSLLNSIIALHSRSIPLERVEDVVHVVHDKGDGNDNDDDELEGHYSSELGQSIRSINSIAGNADFISLY